MATTQTEFVTAPSTPEPDTLQIVVEQKLRRHHHDGGNSSSSMTIFRVPAHVRDASKDLYEPRLVSIGPYYRGRVELRAMEQHKWRYLHDLLAQYTEASLADCVSAVRDVEHQARRCYSERTGIFDDSGDGFAEMLLLDGCFVLKFFINWYARVPDKLCYVGWGLPQILSDLELMENQIPFFVLESLYGALSPDGANVRLDLLMLIVPKFGLDNSALCKQLLDGVLLPTRAEEMEIDHLLHLLYLAFVPTAEELEAIPASPTLLARCVAWLRQMWLSFNTAVSERFAFVRDMPRVPGWTRLCTFMALLHKVSAWFTKLLAMIRVNNTRTEQEEEEPPPEPPIMVVPTVTLLREAGVRFETKPSARHMLDVTFDVARGVLRMPRVKVDYADKAQLVNLIAFEQTRSSSSNGNNKLLSSYAALVGSLVRTAEDVEHLKRHDVIDNLLSCDHDAATEFFQRLGDCSSLDYSEEHHFADMFEDLSQYYHSSWQRHKVGSCVTTAAARGRCSRSSSPAAPFSSRSSNSPPPSIAFRILTVTAS
ncbi:hypothetical protein HU200_067299 [Digitaria exilis]|uniref:Uncharacterized protein n=1 Tax=Digitaria exilis TaxID=1010633 RepID=A0A835A6D4_9POAL|nr:hypothetical protein HU200_067299 [Digitaria exilis]